LGKQDLSLYQLGAIQFQVTPVNISELSRETGSDFAAKDVMRAPRLREFVGEADERLTFAGTLFPQKSGGLSGIDALQANADAGQWVGFWLVCHREGYRQTQLSRCHGRRPNDRIRDQTGQIPERRLCKRHDVDPDEPVIMTIKKLEVATERTTLDLHLYRRLLTERI
jgi:hypothetical protein